VAGFIRKGTPEFESCRHGCLNKVGKFPAAGDGVKNPPPEGIGIEGAKGWVMALVVVAGAVDGSLGPRFIGCGRGGKMLFVVGIVPASL
jgi:hypothetical protein